MLAGCAATQQARDVEMSGFLGEDYALLEEGEEGAALLEYVASDAPWSSYDSIKLEPVTIWTGDDSAFEEFSEEDWGAAKSAWIGLLHRSVTMPTCAEPSVSVWRRRLR